MRSIGTLAVLAAAALASLTLSSSAPAASPIECQHPVLTGVEVSHLKNVSSATACPVALALHSWENKGENGSKLYLCAGGPQGKPVLELHSFDGWALSIGRSGYFEMSRGRRSFDVSGTDFPLACN